jgi:glycosyltransferase involved in cell wall biosynthesis
MKILMIHPHDVFSLEEPWTSRISNIARKLVAFGHEVRLIYFRSPGNETTVHHDTVFPAIGLFRKTRAFPRNITRIIAEARWADIIHVQKCFDYATMPAVLAHIIHNKPLHYDWDDWEFAIYNAAPDSWAGGKYLGYIERMLPRLVDTITVASHGLHSYARSLGVDKNRLFEGHVGVDLDLFRPRRLYSIIEPGLVIYVGQLHGAQYVKLFLDAAARVLEQRKAQFMVVGSGSEQGDLERYARDKGIAPYVQFIGGVPHEDVPRYLAGADVAVACFEENDITLCKSPLKLVEYMAAGKAIVASDVGEVADMLGGCGVLTKPGDPVSLSQGIVALLNNKEKREELGRAARRNAENRFCWSVTTRNVLRAYGKALTFYQNRLARQ